MRHEISDDVDAGRVLSRIKQSTSRCSIYKKKIGALSQWALVQMDMVKVNSQERRKRKRTGGREEGGEWIGLGFDSHG